MAPRHFTNPAPRTESARQAVRSFYCSLCDKGYARMNEFEAHESSYDHQHKKRLKDMKAMQKDPNAGDKARRAERRADEKSGLISIKPVKLDLGSGKAGASGGGFKKGGFKSAFGGVDIKKEDEPADGDVKRVPGFKKIGAPVAVEPLPAAGSQGMTGVLDSDTDEEYEYYDPRHPTDCGDDCPGKLR